MLYEQKIQFSTNIVEINYIFSRASSLPCCGEGAHRRLGGCGAAGSAPANAMLMQGEWQGRHERHQS